MSKRRETPVHSVYVPRNSGKGRWNIKGSIETGPKKEKDLSKSPIFLCFCHGRAHHRVPFLMGQPEWEDPTRSIVEESLAHVAKAEGRRKGDSRKKQRFPNG